MFIPFNELILCLLKLPLNGVFIRQFIMMDYNTQRSKLPLPEYGRNVQQMVDYALTVEDREERNTVVKTIISVMGTLNPHLRDQPDFKHKLWDHLAVMSDFKLVVDSPYPDPSREKLSEKPRPVPYAPIRLKHKHYGRVIQSMVAAAMKLEDGEEKDFLVYAIANQMKKSYLTWNKESVTDDIILRDLGEFSEGMLKLSPEYKLQERFEIQSTSAPKKRIPQHHSRKK